MLDSILKKIFGDPNEKELKNIRVIVDKINSLEKSMESLSSANLAAKTAADTEEISIAMSKVASIAHSTGMELETTAGFLT